MRKLSTLLFTLALFFSISSLAQIKKSSVFLGGNVGFSSYMSTNTTNNLNNNKLTGISISPVIGKAVKENLIVGFDLSYGYNKNDNIGNADVTINKNYGLGFFVRKYKPLGKSDFSIFLQGRLGAGYSTRLRNYNTIYKDEFNQFIIDASLYPGISYNVSKKLQIEAGFNNLVGISYSSGKGEVTGQSPRSYSQKVFSLSSSLNNFNSALSLGFRLLLNKDVKK